MRATGLFFLAAVLFTGCDQSGPTFTTPEAASAPTLVPLAVGNWWAMEGTRVWPDFPDETPRPPQPLGVDTFRVEGDTLIGGERWFDVSAQEPCHAGWYAHREGDLYAWSEEDGAQLRAPFNPYLPAARSTTLYDWEVTRSRLPTPGTIEVGGADFPTVRVSLVPDRYVGDDSVPATTDGSAREVDEYVAGVGFAVSECSYVRIDQERDVFTLAFVSRYVLTDFSLEGE